MPKYVHQPLDEEIRSVGGYYKVLEEGVLEIGSHKVLYVLKGAHVETSCCGSGGMGVLSVPGAVISWKSETNEDGLAVSEVRHITSSKDRERVKALLKERFPYINIVDFD